MINKSTRLLALSTVMLWGGAAMAQEAVPSPTGGSSTSTTTTTTTTSAPGAEAVLPADGTGIQSEDSSVTVSTTEETLPRTGGAPLLMALSGAMTAGGALFGLRKVR